MTVAPVLVYRRIDPNSDARRVLGHHRDACIASFGSDSRFAPRTCLAWLREKAEEFPDGCVLAFLEGQCVGHLEMQVPYGLTTGYVNMFYVTPPFRRMGFGTLMHAYAERYFRSWEALRIELHVVPGNRAAVNLYKKLGYRVLRTEDEGASLWLMGKELP